MAKMSNFDKGFEKFVFKRAQREADLGCRTFNEPGPTSFTKADLEGFQPEGYYIRLFSTFPTLMTPMIAVAASGSFEDGTLEVLKSEINVSQLLITCLFSFPQPQPSTDLAVALLTCAPCSHLLAVGSSTVATPNKSTMLPS